MGEKDLQKYTSPARWDRGSGTKAQRGCTGPIGRAVPRNDGCGTGSIAQNGGAEPSWEPTPLGRAERCSGTEAVARDCVDPANQRCGTVSRRSGSASQWRATASSSTHARTCDSGRHTSMQAGSKCGCMQACRPEWPARGFARCRSTGMRDRRGSARPHHGIASIVAPAFLCRVKHTVPRFHHAGRIYFHNSSKPVYIVTKRLEIMNIFNFFPGINKFRSSMVDEHIFLRAYTSTRPEMQKPTNMITTIGRKRAEIAEKKSPTIHRRGVNELAGDGTAAAHSSCKPPAIICSQLLKKCGQ